jgi:hypothetical protein
MNWLNPILDNKERKKNIWHKEFTAFYNSRNIMLLGAKMKFYVLGLADKPAIFAPNNIYRVLVNGWEQISG